MKEPGYIVTPEQKKVAEGYWNEIRKVYPEQYLSMIRQFRMEIKRSTLGRTEFLGKGKIRLVLNPLELTTKGKKIWTYVHELGHIVTLQGVSGDQIDYYGKKPTVVDEKGGLYQGRYVLAFEQPAT